MHRAHFQGPRARHATHKAAAYIDCQCSVMCNKQVARCESCVLLSLCHTQQGIAVVVANCRLPDAHSPTRAAMSRALGPQLILVLD